MFGVSEELIGLYSSSSTMSLIIIVVVALIVGTFCVLLVTGSGRLLKQPTVFIINVCLAIELILYVVVRLIITAIERLDLFGNPKHQKLRKDMKNAKSYEEWFKLGRELDIAEKRNNWPTDLNDFTAKNYSWDFLKEVIADMKASRENDDIYFALRLLNDCTRRNVGGIFREELYSYTNTGEPKLIVTEFVDEVVTTLKWVTLKASQDEGCSSDVYKFLQHASVIYGKTALCLSGGAMLGNYHFGTISALFEAEMLPNIVSGSSAGAIIGGLVCTKTDDELREWLDPDVARHKVVIPGTYTERFTRLFTKGYLIESKDLLENLKTSLDIGDMTFAEAYAKTGRVLNVSISTTTRQAPPLLLNYMSGPDIVVASAICASAAAPGVQKPVNLQTKDPTTGKIRVLKENFFDGSIEQDIPIAGLSEMLNCNFFIVAQANPHIVPFHFKMDGDIGKPNTWTNTRRGGYLLSGLELFLKIFMGAKLKFLKEVGADDSPTSYHQTYDGSTNIVHEVTPMDFVRIMEAPTLKSMINHFQGGKVTTYRNFALIKLHYKITDAINVCLADCEKQQEEKEEESGNANEEFNFRASTRLKQQKTKQPLVTNKSKYLTRQSMMRGSMAA